MPKDEIDFRTALRIGSRLHQRVRDAYEKGEGIELSPKEVQALMYFRIDFSQKADTDSQPPESSSE